MKVENFSDEKVREMAIEFSHNPNKIVEAHIADFIFDGIEYSAYGFMHDGEPELIQVSFKGSAIDLFPMLSKSHFDSLSNALIDLYLNK